MEFLLLTGLSPAYRDPTIERPLSCCRDEPELSMALADAAADATRHTIRASTPPDDPSSHPLRRCRLLEAR